MGSTEDQITTQTKFPIKSMSGSSVRDAAGITCDVSWVGFGEANNSNNTDEANTVISVSDRSSQRCEVTKSTYNPAIRNVPVKTHFCRVEVRRRHSRGTGLKS